MKNTVIDGILLLDKSIGISSNNALQRVKRLFAAKKAGHTGSLDPLATGMLPICFGEATKFSQYLLDSNKFYRVLAKMGIETTTGDAEGEIIRTHPVKDITVENVNRVLPSFLGTISQIPPMYSAIKFKGKPLYELARRGIEIPRAPRQITIYHIACLTLTEECFELVVHCSKGTYVRTLVEDIGRKLGCGAHVVQLRRDFVAPYKENAMYTFDSLEEMVKKSGHHCLKDLILPVETSVKNLPKIKLSSALLFYLRSGQPVLVPHAPTQGLVQLFSEHGSFLGIGEILEDGRVAPKRLIVKTESTRAYA